MFVWHPTDASLFRRKWLDLPSTSTLRGWEGTGTERSLATATEVGEPLSDEDMNPFDRDDCVPEHSYPAGDATHTQPGNMNNRRRSDPDTRPYPRNDGGVYP